MKSTSHPPSTAIQPVQIRGIAWWPRMVNGSIFWRRAPAQKAIHQPWCVPGAFWEIRSAGKDGRGQTWFTTHLMKMDRNGVILEEPLTKYATPMSTTVQDAARIAEEE